MLYYRVKNIYDNEYCNGRCLIGGELYTEKEVERYKIAEKYIEAVNIKKNDTYYSFGSRSFFGNELGYIK